MGGRWRLLAPQLVLAVCGVLQPAQALYFLLGKVVPRRCFVEERPEETVLQIRTRFLDYAEGRGLEIEVSPFDAAAGGGWGGGGGGRPAARTGRTGRAATVKPVQYSVTEAVSTYEYEVPESGEYGICVGVKGAAPAGAWRVELEISLGQDDEYYEQQAEKNNLDAVQVQLERLSDRVIAILNEADYMKEKEVDFHKTSVQMNYTALWWPMVQMTILVVAGIFQVQYLKSFFKKRKLI
ncbi:emp24/gp25L/p24 family/GOLD-domain-containing protein [Tribonema minus]|uniref:Emp24/gp25L/p24 family/GOLD-domain-containing protein n=1 Tax=Tribonema minus TaxID=303371 RepID=A0A835YQQ7_9STRA|nr:emp24/gp25L/p24 family/GOLD-domain-containing protein [Tribonema minus]